MSKKLRILVASKSEIKLKAARAFFATDPKRTIEIVPMSCTPTTTHVQPRGVFEALVCLYDRISGAVSQTTNIKDYSGILAIENFVFLCTDEGVDKSDSGSGVYRDGVSIAYFDFACEDYKFHIDTGSGVAIPNAIVPALQSREPLTCTVGELLRPVLGHHKAYKHDDWYIAAGETEDRAECIVQELEMAEFRY